MGHTSRQSLVDEFFERVHRYVRMRVPAREIDDVVAEVFLRAIEREGQRRSAEPGPWLFSIARSRVAEYYRRREAAVSAQDLSEPARETPLERLEREEFVALLHRKMGRLSEVERDVIAFKFAFKSTGGLSNSEIAALVGVTPSHLGVLLHRALGKLRRAMLKGAGDGVQ